MKPWQAKSTNAAGALVVLVVLVAVAVYLVTTPGEETPNALDKAVDKASHVVEAAANVYEAVSDGTLAEAAEDPTFWEGFKAGFKDFFTWG